MSRPSFLEIDRTAFQHNLQRLSILAPDKKIMALVKADAYGHGVAALASELADVDNLAVCCLEEALECRRYGLTQSIVLMEGFFESSELAIIRKENFQIVIHHDEQIRTLEKIADTSSNNPLTVWLKIDTGMNRLGFVPAEISAVLARLEKINNINQPIGLMTHFSDADEPNKPKTKQQLDRFITVTKDLTGPRSLANSAAIIAHPETQGDWIRPGIMLYGISPFSNKTALELNLKPVMTLYSKIMAIHQAKQGETVGYGSTWPCPENMNIGVVAIGYGDGYPRHAKHGTPILVNAKEVPLIGRVSMDMLTVDLRTQPDAKIGDPVILWGRGLPIEKIAQSADTIPYELVCSVKKRIKRIIL